MKLPLTVTIITLNEEHNLPRCIESIIDLACEVIVVDSGSIDLTESIARKYGAIFVKNSWKGNISQNQYAFSLCTNPWVLSIDADEVVTPELKNAIRTIFEGHMDDYDGFYVNRRTQYLGKWIWHVWYPEWRLRLVRKENASWVGPDPHGHLEVVGATKKLKADLLHYTYRNLDDQLHKISSYAKTSADINYQHDIKTSLLRLLFSPWLRFLRDVFVKGAWRDGRRGVLIAYMGAFSSFLKQAYLYENYLKKYERESEK
ncbi:MAG: glycosyltransferase family 2 protein [Bacteroidales bacterium]|jgi:glycosyltransferase involved in cell wall biosynthesis|nr:glycosyltransferase family 2 protein [Bacteroidales bacterium]